MTIHRRFLTGLLLAFMATSVWAQSWPTRPVRMIIAFPPGGPTDLVSRVLAQRLSEQLGQQVIVDNKPGAGGNLAAELAVISLSVPVGYSMNHEDVDTDSLSKTLLGLWLDGAVPSK